MSKIVNSQSSAKAFSTAPNSLGNKRVHFICRIRKVPSEHYSHHESLHSNTTSYNTSTQRSIVGIVSPSQRSSSKVRAVSSKRGGGSIGGTPGRSSSKPRSRSKYENLSLSIVSAVNPESIVLAIGDSAGIKLEAIKERLKEENAMGVFT
jgi:hypothetical protein